MKCPWSGREDALCARARVRMAGVWPLPECAHAGGQKPVLGGLPPSEPSSQELSFTHRGPRIVRTSRKAVKTGQEKRKGALEEAPGARPVRTLASESQGSHHLDPFNRNLLNRH